MENFHRHAVTCLQSSSVSNDSSRASHESSVGKTEECCNKLTIVRRGGRSREKNKKTTERVPKKEPKKTLYLTDESVAKGLVPCACGQDCFKKVPLHLLKAYREQFWSKGAKEQRAYLKGELIRDRTVKIEPSQNLKIIKDYERKSCAERQSVVQFLRKCFNCKLVRGYMATSYWTNTPRQTRP